MTRDANDHRNRAISSWITSASWARQHEPRQGPPENVVTVNVKARTGPAAPGRHHPRDARLSVETSTPGQDAVPRCRRRSRGPYAAVVDVLASRELPRFVVPISGLVPGQFLCICIAKCHRFKIIYEKHT
jgi:hypothetical protein